MITQKPRPVIGLLVTGNAVYGSGVPLPEKGTSPRSPLDCKIQSPRRRKNFDAGGIGLGIVAALDKHSCDRSEIPAKTSAVGCRNGKRSAPIPVISTAKASRKQTQEDEVGEVESDSLEEECTYVTCRMSNKCFTKVYRFDRKHEDSDESRGHIGNGLRNKRGTVSGGCVFEISPPTKLGELTARNPTSNFLEFCQSCNKNLEGEDIYMYRGERGFCSAECRQKQMGIDECKEQCGSEGSRASSWTNGQMFAIGIFAT